MMRLAPCFALVLTLSLASSLAAAQDDPRIAEARAHFDAAEGYVRNESYTLALPEYRRAQQLMEAAGHTGAVLLHYNIAFCNFRLGRFQEALDGFEAYLAGTDAGAPSRAEAQNYASEARNRLASGEGSSGGGEVVSPIGVVIASVGAAAAIAGAILGGVALSDSDAARAGCGAMDVCPPSARDGIASAQTLANVADGLLFGGLAVAATGVVLMFVLADGGDDASASAMCTPDGCAAVVRGAF